jgi:poly-gamma-glutamate synthesis protein (capsule biosynthesis protein)
MSAGNAAEATFMAVGDIVIEREEPASIFASVSSILNDSDLVFAQCEQMYSDIRNDRRVESTSFAKELVHARGTFSHPRNVPALREAGIDVVGLASNCTMDWGADCLLDTIERLRGTGISVVGAGKDLASARQPACFELGGARVAVLAYCSVGRPGEEAQEDKPGFVPVRAHTMYKPEDYQPGTPPRILSFADRGDVEAMTADIKQAKAEADIVIVSQHWGVHFLPAVIPDYEFEVGHAAIDAGADLIVGHHPHILKGIEVYKGKTIFHSLGNFALELGPRSGEPLRNAMKWEQQKYGFKADDSCPMYPFSRESRATLIAKAVIRDGSIVDVSCIPCWINDAAEPCPMVPPDPLAEEVREYVELISSSQRLSTKLSWRGSELAISSS